jgi:geranylgeranyl pyrophosphate synthase
LECKALREDGIRVAILHNVSLVIDDIVDNSETRRNRLTLHNKFGQLAALMTAGYIVADGFCLARDDLQAILLFSELLKRLAAAECMQWRLRRQPLGVEDWRKIAGEDTGSMFEVAACLGDRTERLRKFGGLLGLLYHGCDDVADVRGTTALGGGGYDDLRDGILTLPAALAIRDPEIARVFCNPNTVTSNTSRMRSGKSCPKLRRTWTALQKRLEPKRSFSPPIRNHFSLSLTTHGNCPGSKLNTYVKLSSTAFAFLRSSVSNPSVNQP